MTTFIKEIDKQGFSILPRQFDRDTISTLDVALQKLIPSQSVKTKNGSAYGIRNLLNLCPAIKDFAEHPGIKSVVESVLGLNAKVVRAIYFDKTPGANWKVALHQDLTITVRDRIDTKGFTAWSNKSGVFHVQPPVSVLESMLTLRISLDRSDESNGALRVIAGSHKLGRLNNGQIKQLRDLSPPVLCDVECGGILVMRPLLLHSSSTSNGAHRRVIHLEFSGSHLPAGLEWFGS